MSPARRERRRLDAYPASLTGLAVHAIDVEAYRIRNRRLPSGYTWDDAKQDAYPHVLWATDDWRDVDDGMTQRTWLYWKARLSLLDAIRAYDERGRTYRDRAHALLSRAATPDRPAVDYDQLPGWMREAVRAGLYTDIRYRAYGGVDPGYEQVEDAMAVHSALADCPLTANERFVIVGYFWGGKFLWELGAMLGLTESGASRLRASALAKLGPFLSARYDEVIPVMLHGARAT